MHQARDSPPLSRFHWLVDAAAMQSALWHSHVPRQRPFEEKQPNALLSMTMKNRRVSMPLHISASPPRGLSAPSRASSSSALRAPLRLLESDARLLDSSSFRVDSATEIAGFSASRKPPFPMPKSTRIPLESEEREAPFRPVFLKRAHPKTGASYTRIDARNRCEILIR